MGAPAILFDLHTEPPIEGMKFALDKLAAGVSDFSGLFEGYDALFQSFMQRQFASEGSFGAGGWAALSPAYDAWKQEHYPGRPIGVLTGALRESMTGGSGYRSDIGSTSASYGMDASSKAAGYGGYFDDRRKVIKWGGKQSREFQKFTHVWLNNEIAMAFGGGSFGMSNPAVPGAFSGGL